MTTYRTDGPEPTPCSEQPFLYWQLDPDATPPASPQGKARLDMVRRTASELCQSRCPRFEQCLRDAVFGQPVAGFVAGTTEDQRDQLRSILQVESEPVANIGRLAGAADGVGVNAAQVMHLISTYPKATNSELGRLANCDPHTIARYRRTGRRVPAAEVTDEALLTAFVDTTAARGRPTRRGRPNGGQDAAIAS